MRVIGWFALIVQTVLLLASLLAIPAAVFPGGSFWWPGALAFAAAWTAQLLLIAVAWTVFDTASDVEAMRSEAAQERREAWLERHKPPGS